MDGHRGRKELCSRDPVIEMTILSLQPLLCGFYLHKAKNLNWQLAPITKTPPQFLDDDLLIYQVKQRGRFCGG
ncbi:hypothetical protein Zmor_001655 [Zophobas morio]|uniref:Uncharacterized protein n=1 Tax=Zophobas morio TaxID=2755281 RepID=A0AA38MSU6_9CUCU|nr:hypothetical protein Zmor_001655 [Zophobas morio]